MITSAPFFQKRGSAGKPSILSEVAIMDPDGNIVNSNISGEIVVRSPLVFQGYWNLKDENTFRYNWHHTGDKGFLDNEGYLIYEGRLSVKDLIKPGGENVYPSEVEDIILKHPLVEDVCVIGVQDEYWGEAIKAICVLKRDTRLEEDLLKEFVASKIARYKKPIFIEYVSNLPKAKDGETDRDEVQRIYNTDCK